MRGLLLTMLLFFTLFARENPFEPLVTESESTILNKTPFTSINAHLPDNSRVLKSVVLRYQTLNGSIEEKTIEVDKSIDWHQPIHISQSTSSKNYQKVSFKFIDFYIKKKKILISTDHKIIRDFVLTKPVKLVCDFQGDRKFLTFSKSLQNFVKNITIGNHKGYFRVVFLLDGRYTYKIKKVTEGYLIEFR